MFVDIGVALEYSSKKRTADLAFSLDECIKISTIDDKVNIIISGFSITAVEEMIRFIYLRKRR